MPYPAALKACGCQPIPIPSLPASLTKYLVKRMNLKSFPSYLLNYYKFPVVLDGSLFQNTFGFQPKHTTPELFEFYQEQKQALLS